MQIRYQSKAGHFFPEKSSEGFVLLNDVIKSIQEELKQLSLEMDACLQRYDQAKFDLIVAKFAQLTSKMIHLENQINYLNGLIQKKLVDEKGIKEEIQTQKALFEAQNPAANVEQLFVEMSELLDASIAAREAVLSYENSHQLNSLLPAEQNELAQLKQKAQRAIAEYEDAQAAVSKIQDKWKVLIKAVKETNDAITLLDALDAELNDAAKIIKRDYDVIQEQIITIQTKKLAITEADIKRAISDLTNTVQGLEKAYSRSTYDASISVKDTLNKQLVDVAKEAKALSEKKLQLLAQQKEELVTKIETCCESLRKIVGENELFHKQLAVFEIRKEKFDFYLKRYNAIIDQNPENCDEFLNKQCPISYLQTLVPMGEFDFNKCQVWSPESAPKLQALLQESKKQYKLLLDTHEKEKARRAEAEEKLQTTKKRLDAQFKELETEEEGVQTHHEELNGRLQVCFHQVDQLSKRLEKCPELLEKQVKALKTNLDTYLEKRNKKYKAADDIKLAIATISIFKKEKKAPELTDGQKRANYIAGLKSALDGYVKTGDKAALYSKVQEGLLFKSRKSKKDAESGLTLESQLEAVSSALKLVD